MSMARPVLELRDLRPRAETIVDSLDVRLRQGEILAVVAHRAEGLAAFGACLALRTPPASGAILLHGIDVATPTDDRRRAFLGQAVAVVGPPDRRGLGPGLRHRPLSPSPLGLAAALSGSFEVVIADGALDGSPDDPQDGPAPIEAVELLWALARRSRPTFPAVVVLTERVDVAAAVADQVAVFDRGRLVDQGPSTHVLAGAAGWSAALGVRPRSA
jgi:ABC-type glutathione transport system ATPase component